MTVSASPADIATIQPNQPTVGKGQLLLNAIAAVQTLVNAYANPAAQASLLNELNRRQIEAVNYFMGSYWVAADVILATISIPSGGSLATRNEITRLQALITNRQNQVNTLIAAGIPVSPVGNEASQYSTAYPPPMSGYPLTLPDSQLYSFQMQLVNLLMATSLIPASQILSTMTGTQTYPWNGYISNYTYYQNDIDGYGDG
jgi:hypothetical protein